MTSRDELTIAVIGGSGAMGRKVRDVCRGAYQTVSIENLKRDDISRERSVFMNLDEAVEFTGMVGCVIDFSVPKACVDAAKWCAKNSIPFVSGTTGLTDDDMDTLRDVAKTTAVLYAANFSLGIATLKRLVASAAKMLPTWDAEIWEAHHRRKVDAPSGTALLLGHAVADARGDNFDDVAKLSREGVCGARQAGEIGFQAIRAGSIVGEHTVMFASDVERIELSHKASDRGVFASGAVDAAIWLLNKPPGFYTIDDVLGAS